MFIFISVFPLAFKSVGTDLLPDPSLQVSEKQFMEHQDTSRQSFVSQKSDLESLLDKNMSQIARQIVTNFIIIFQNAIQTNDEITELESQISGLMSQNMDIINRTSNYLGSNSGYSTIYPMISFFGLSIIACLLPISKPFKKFGAFNSFNIAKVFTIVGIGMIVISIIIIIETTHGNIEELNKLSDKNQQSINNLFTKLHNASSEQDQTLNAIHTMKELLQNLSAPIHK